jgi:hypothetical protein
VLRHRSTISLGSVFLLLGVLGADTAPSPSQRILDAARHVLSAAKESHYQHVTHVDEAAGVYDVDCSGLLCYVLKTVAPGHYAVVPGPKIHRRPLALQFYEAITAGSEKTARYWHQVHNVQDARPGDILVWRRAEQVPGKDTGHVMIIDQPPIEDGPGLYRVTVIDSTGGPHARDTRHDGATGVGRGTLWLETDPDGRPIAYHWKLKTGKPHSIEIAIGRAVEPN